MGGLTFNNVRVATIVYFLLEKMAAATVDRDKSFESALECTLNDLELNFTLKNEQITALKSFILKRDVVGVLPTGYGKSVIYQLAPLVAKRMGISENPMVVIVSPLIALMEDQLKGATKFGLSARQLGKGDLDEIRSGRCQLLYGMLATKVFQENLLGIVVDEVHLIYKW